MKGKKEELNPLVEALQTEDWENAKYQAQLGRINVQ
jgi:hypothetical protein